MLITLIFIFVEQDNNNKKKKKKKKKISLTLRLPFLKLGSSLKESSTDPDIVDDTIDWWSKYFTSKGQVQPGQVGTMLFGVKKKKHRRGDYGKEALIVSSEDIHICM